MQMEEYMDQSASNPKTPPRSISTTSEKDDTHVKQLHKKYLNLKVLITLETLKRTMSRNFTLTNVLK